MPNLSDVLIWLPVISLLPTYVALRARNWSFGLLASLIPLPLAVLYVFLLILPALQLAGTIALRWRVGSLGWLCLLGLGVVIWAVGVAGPLYLEWSAGFYFVFLLGFVAGLLVLLWSHPPRVMQ